MSSEIIIENMSRHFTYTVILNGAETGDVLPLKTFPMTVEAGSYELSFKDSDIENLPTTCKPIQIDITESKILHLKVTTNDFSICVFDDHGTLLNGKRGFLSGYIADGIHIENPIT